MWEIEVLSGPLDGHMFQFQKEASIGRRGDIEIGIDRFISRKHGILKDRGTQVAFEDLNSTNGSFYQGHKIEGQVLLPEGAIFRVGRTWLKLEHS